MKIEDNHNSNMEFFKDIKIGSTFIYENNHGKLYLKMHLLDGLYNAFNFTTNEFVFFNGNTGVRVVNAKVVIE